MTYLVNGKEQPHPEVTFTKISPLGKRKGFGTFDCFFDTTKYKSLEAATAMNDYVVVDFVEDERGLKYFCLFHSKKPEECIYQTLQIQHFPFGIDIMDDQTACRLADELLKANR
jgi:hypothetical protein